MGICEPKIRVECDQCWESDEYEMTMLAGGGWDDRNLKRQMDRAGWVVKGNDTYCAECATHSSGERTT